MCWIAFAFLGVSSYILLMIAPYILIAIIIKSPDIIHNIAGGWARWAFFCSRIRADVERKDNIAKGACMVKPGPVLFRIDRPAYPEGRDASAIMEEVHGKMGSSCRDSL